MIPVPGSLILDVYDSDGTAIDWSVSSDSRHERPYLLGPQNYEGQEIDPVAAAASIGTVEVGVIDPAQTPGDQTTGWMTERIGSIRGRRCRLRRYVSASIGYVMIVDGPAGTPRLDDSYSAYRWPIRDTREIERKIGAFTNGGTTGILPRGPIAGFAGLIPAVTPIVGEYFVSGAGNPRAGYVDFSALWSGGAVDPSLVVDEDQEAAFAAQGDGGQSVFPDADILWRIEGSDDPWNVARPATPPPWTDGQLPIADVQAGTVDGNPVRAIRRIILWMRDPDAPLDGTEPFGADDVEGVGEMIEVVIRHRGAASDEFPFYWEGTAGELLADLYDGVLAGLDDLSEAARLTDDLYDPGGLQVGAGLLAGRVKYDPAALAAMTEPVLVREKEPVEDGRDWAESTIYGPSGWIPALDNDGVVSPVSRNRPSVVTGPAIVNANAEPSPDWNAGERIVTAVSLTHRRYFAGNPLFVALEEPDGIAVREITLTFIDADAESREGEQRVEYDGHLFASIGDEFGNAIEGDVEIGALLGQTARYEVLGRYRNGAQAIRVRALRAGVPTLRVGDWCPVALTWLPNTATGFRGMNLAAAQVLSIGDSESAWRYLLLEESAVFAPPGFLDLAEIVGDEGSPGYLDLPELISDEETP